MCLKKKGEENVQPWECTEDDERKLVDMLWEKAHKMIHYDW